MDLSSSSKKSGAFALLTMMASMVVILVVFTGAMYWVVSNAKQERRNQEFTTSEAAAEGATEVIFAHMDRDFLYGNLDTTGSNYISLTPVMTSWPVQYIYNSEIDMGVQEQVLSYLGAQYANLVGEPQTNTITVTAIPQDELYNVPASVSQTFVFATVPVFQFAIFYNLDLEIDPGHVMPIAGPVFSNAGIWSGTTNVTYSSTVEAAGSVNITASDPFCSSKSDVGTPQANFQYAGPPSQPESNVNPLVLPIGTSGQNNSTNVEAIINLPPASLAAPLSIAYQQTNQVYDFNAASLIVSNWNFGTNGGAPWNNNFTVYLQDSVQHPAFVQSPTNVPRNWVELTNDFYVISNNDHSIGIFTTNYVPNFQFTNSWAGFNWTGSGAGTDYVWYAGFSFLTNASFYDYRESALVQAVQLDVGKLRVWITNALPNGGSTWNGELCNDIGHAINSVYIYNAVPFIGQQQLPAVRVIDGALLPSSTCSSPNGPVTTSGLTVVTPQPLYVLGDYNVETNGGPVVTGMTNSINTYPAAFMADSITVLSSNWPSDGGNSSYSSRPALNTTVNAACLEGIVPSTPSNYSGGVENFLRLLEDWDDLTLTYNGSIIVMFQSQYATNLWKAPDGNNGVTSYYGTPVRNWSFDTNYLTAPGLPPLTPDFRTVVRNTWSGY